MSLLLFSPAGTVGGVSELPSVTVEIAFATDPGATTPVWTNVTPTVRSVSIRRGRQHELDRVEAGTASITLHDVDGRYSPQNIAGPYYPNVLPMRRIRVRGTFQDQTFDVFHGYVEAWPQQWEFAPRSASTVTIRCVDGFKALALAKVTTTRTAELSGARVTAVLDAMGWPSLDRTINAGISTVQAVELTDEPALQHLQDVVMTEGGLLSISREGKVMFLDRTKVVTSELDTANHTWGDNGDPAEHEYASVELSFDDTQIWNDAKVTAPGKTDGTASDPTSQTRYFRRTLVLSGLWDNQNEMQARSEYTVTRFGEPGLRVTAMSLNPRFDEQWTHILHHDLHDKLRVIRHPTDTIEISQDSLIEGIAHDIGPNRWNVNLTLSPLDRVTDYFIWGVSQWGINTRWYY